MIDRTNLAFFEFVAIHALRMEFDFTDKQAETFRHALRYWLTDAEQKMKRNQGHE